MHEVQECLKRRIVHRFEGRKDIEKTRRCVAVDLSLVGFDEGA